MPTADQPTVGSAGTGTDGSEPAPSARSVIASILLPLQEPELSGQALVRCCELFGIGEGTSRVALSRMVRAGELSGGSGRYRLTGRLLERQARQEQGRHPELAEWRGRWLVALVAPDRRRRPASQRAALRSDMRRLRMAEVREGSWVRPDNLTGFDAMREASVSASGCLWFEEAELVDGRGSDASEICSRLFDLDAWAGRARVLSMRLEATEPALESGDTGALATGFQSAAAVVRHLTGDPLLPEELLGPHWPGPDLREHYDRYEGLYRRVLREWLAGRPGLSDLRS